MTLYLFLIELVFFFIFADRFGSLICVILLMTLLRSFMRHSMLKVQWILYFFWRCMFGGEIHYFSSCALSIAVSAAAYTTLSSWVTSKISVSNGAYKTTDNKDGERQTAVLKKTSEKRTTRLSKPWNFNKLSAKNITNEKRRNPVWLMISYTIESPLWCYKKPKLQAKGSRKIRHPTTLIHFCSTLITKQPHTEVRFCFKRS